MQDHYPKLKPACPPRMALKQTPSSQFAPKLDVQLFKDQTLGIGSYGKVCRARYGSLPCAAKLIHETLFDPEASKQIVQEKKHRLPFKRFEQECEVLHNLRHPNVIQYLGVYQDPDTKLPVLLMELMDGSLTHYLEDPSLQQIPFHIQVNFCHDIALALSFLHANKVIHRDLSSNNVLLISTIRAKVTDFGMATLRVNEQATQFSHTMCPGTDAYMPPEAIQDKPVYTEKIDCFSFGVLVIQILTQLFPAPGNRHEEMKNHPGLRKGRKVMVTVPEVERRENHIALIDPNHPLLVIALDCLKDLESDRPSALQICERVAALKESAEYTKSNKESERSNLKEKELHEALAAKEKEIAELKKQLTFMSAAKDQGIAQQQKEQPSLDEKEPKIKYPNYLTSEALDQQLGKLSGTLTEKVQKPNQGKNQCSKLEPNIGFWDPEDLPESGPYDTGLPQPVFINKSWYHGVLSRQEAERRMREMDMNTFLVRESVQDSGNLILSVKNHDKCYHFPIDRGIGKYEIQGTHMPFSSVQELVNYYMQNGLPESSGGKLIQLIKPCTTGIARPVSPRIQHAYTSIDDTIDDHSERKGDNKPFKLHDLIHRQYIGSLHKAGSAGSRSRPPLSRKLQDPPPHRFQPLKLFQPDSERHPPTPAQKYANTPGSTLQKLPILSDLTRLQEQSKNLMPLWYKPQFSREEAISCLLDKDPGLFVVRDSTTVIGGYALTVRMSPEQVRARRKLPNDTPITKDMLVTHFLIQQDPEGIKLQGWNERAFKTLPEFIAHHTVEKLCLPCKLVLPQSSSGGVPQVERKPAGMKQALQTGAADDESLYEQCLIK